MSCTAGALSQECIIIMLQVYGVCFSALSSSFATCSKDKTIRTWDHDFKPLAVGKGHAKRVVACIASPSDRTFATVAGDGQLRTWKGPPEQPMSAGLMLQPDGE